MYLSDEEIRDLLAEPKPEIDDRALLASMQTTPQGHRRAAVTVEGDAGTAFQVAVRQSVLDPDNFSAILTVVESGASLNLRRYNGPTHPHRNKLEGEDVDFVCHVHQATQRYQDAGFEAEGYAERRSDFADLGGALRAMLHESGFRPPAQGTMV